MLKIIHIAQLTIAITLTVAILMQNRGAGLSQTFGGDFGGYYTRRGFERFLVYISVTLAIFFIGLSIISLILGRSLPA